MRPSFPPATRRRRRGAGGFFFPGSPVCLPACLHAAAGATPQDPPFGLVSGHCGLTATAGADRVYLVRPWRDPAPVAFLDSTLGAHLLAAGGHDRARPERPAGSFFAEGGNRGPGAGTAARVPGSHRPHPAQASRYTRDDVAGDWSPFE